MIIITIAKDIKRIIKNPRLWGVKIISTKSMGGNKFTKRVSCNNS